MNGSTTLPRWVLVSALVGTFLVATSAVAVLRARSSGIDELRREVDALRSARPQKAVVRELRTVVREPAVPAPAQGDGGPATGAEHVGPETQPPLTPEEAQHRADVIVAAREKTLEESFGRETPDAAWSQAATASLRSAYSGEGFEALRIDSECRATLCRVIFDYTDASGELQSRNFIQRMPWRGALNSTLDAQARRGTFYLARQGFTLPDIDESTLEF